MEDKIYMDWLNKTTSVDSENDRTTISKLQKANRILTEKLNMQSEKEYTMVKENNGVTEMQKEMGNAIKIFHIKNLKALINT